MGKLRIGPSDAPVINNSQASETIITKIVEVPVEIIREVPVEVIVEKIVEVVREVEKPVIIEKLVEVIKEIEKPIVIREFEKVEVPVEVIVEKIVTVHDTQLILKEKQKNESLQRSLKTHKAAIAVLIVLTIIMAAL